MHIHQKKRTTDMLSNLLKDLADIGAAINNDIELNVTILPNQMKCINYNE